MIKNFFRHLHTVNKHRFLVFVHCCKIEMVWRGFIHDLSKYSPTEFFEGVKYYQGTRSPITACRNETGMSKAWLHHKGRNKHHPQYWFDPECKQYLDMPYKYVVEKVCDMLAASKVYKGKNYSTQYVYEYWQKIRGKREIGEKTKLFLDQVMLDLKDKGQKYVLNKKYMESTYQAVFSQNLEAPLPEQGVN